MRKLLALAAVAVVLTLAACSQTENAPLDPDVQTVKTFVNTGNLTDTQIGQLLDEVCNVYHLQGLDGARQVATQDFNITEQDDDLVVATYSYNRCN